MKRKTNRVAMGMLTILLTVWLLPLTAAGKSPPRILRMQMEGQTDIALYFAAALEDALFGRVQISREPGQEERKRVMQPENLVLELTTDAQGRAQISMSELELEDGVYLAAGEGFSPFYVCVPAPEGDGWTYTVEVSPGYRIGGEAEPVPAVEKTVEIAVENHGELGGVMLVLAACCAFFLRLVRSGFL